MYLHVRPCTDILLLQNNTYGVEHSLLLTCWGNIWIASVESITAQQNLCTYLRSYDDYIHRRRGKEEEESNPFILHCGAAWLYICVWREQHVHIIIALYKISQTPIIFRARSENECCTKEKRMQRQQRSICRGLDYCNTCSCAQAATQSEVQFVCSGCCTERFPIKRCRFHLW